MMTPETIILFDGVEQSIADHALDYGIPASRIILRINAGWSIEAAITRPVSIATGVEPRRKQPDQKAKGYVRRQGGPRVFAYAGKVLTIKQWAQETGISERSIRNRLWRGASIERAMTDADLRKSKSPLITHNGETKSLRSWAKQAGISPQLLRHRLAKGMPLDDALETVDHRKDGRNLIAHNGETLGVHEWAKRTGIPAATITSRIHRGWSPADALTIRPLTREGHGSA